MRENRQLRAGAAVAIAVAMVVGTSAFAESRPSQGTRSRGDAGGVVRRGSVSARGTAGRGDESRNGSTTEQRSSRNSGSRERATVDGRSARSGEGRERSTPREEGQTYERRNSGRSNGSNGSDGRSYERRSDNRSGNRGSDGSYRGNGDRNGNRNGNRGGDSRWNGGSNNNRGGSYSRGRSYGGRTPYYHQGRISNYSRYGSGYRVWIIGSPYPFYVPLAYWNPGRFRIGLSIGLGGYYNDGGYYDYYDGYRDGVRDRYYDNNVQSEADFRGVVESVDWRRDTFVVRNEASGSFVTVILRDRREGDIRAGDFVEVRGDWTSHGTFRAYDVDRLD